MDDDDRAELHRQKSQIESLTRGNLKLQAEVDRLREGLAANLAMKQSYKDEIKQLRAAIDRGGWDLSPCMVCNETVVCLPDGLPMCEACARTDTKIDTGKGDVMTNEELEMLRGMQAGVAIRIADLEAEVERLREYLTDIREEAKDCDLKSFVMICDEALEDE